MKDNLRFGVNNLTIFTFFISLSFLSFSQEIDGELLDDYRLEELVSQNRKDNRPSFHHIITCYEIKLDKTTTEEIRNSIALEIKKVEGVNDFEFKENDRVLLIIDRNVKNNFIYLFESVIVKSEIMISSISEKTFKIN